MNYKIISTGSVGNCTILNKSIMLDCGVSYKQIKEELREVQVIFISHIHSDHLKKSTIKKIAYMYPNIKFIVGFYLVDTLVSLGVQKKNLFVLDIDKWYDIGIAKVRLEALYHDIPNVCIKIEMNNKKMIYAVDTNKIEHIEAKDYDLYLIEANYTDEEELENRIKQDYDNGLTFSHYNRVKTTHLSQVKAYNWLEKNKKDDSVYIFMHEHIDR